MNLVLEFGVESGGIFHNMATGGKSLRGDLSGFPSLKIEPNDVNGSWKRFLTQFRLQIKYQILSCGTKSVKVKDEETKSVDVFDDELKCIALLTSVGSEGQSVLLSKGFRIDQDDFVLNYKDALTALDAHYGREESLNVRIHKMINSRQDIGEDSRDFSRRIEAMGRNLEIFFPGQTLDNAREKFTEVLVVNGLRDIKLRKELLAMPNLDWARLNQILSSRGTAEDAESKLENDVSTSSRRPIVTQHVAEASFQGSNHYRGRQSRFDDRDSVFDDETSYSRNKSSFRSRRDSQSHDSYYDKRDHSREHKQSKDSRRCYRCGGDHLLCDCEFVTCLLCQNQGHIAIDCPHRHRGDSRDHSARSSSPQRCNRVQFSHEHSSRNSEFPQSMYPQGVRFTNDNDSIRWAKSYPDNFVSFQD